MDWLKELRIQQGLTQEQLAAAVGGIVRTTYTNIENGERRPSVEVAKRIAEVLGFAWTRFFEEEQDSA